ncbi:hypothetical protein, partial [Klebsiella aerogenes]|uniref:hypothetical protein n=1 Tax=Klebsiella aerogenes TaxID=548 RepID=UPI001CC3C37C
NCSVVLLKNPVITAQTRALSQEGCPLQHVQIASSHFMLDCFTKEGQFNTGFAQKMTAHASG